MQREHYDSAERSKAAASLKHFGSIDHLLKQQAKLEKLKQQRDLMMLQVQEEQLTSNDVLPRNFDSNHSLLATKCLAGNSYADEERLIGPGKSEVVQALKAHKDESKRRRAQASLGSRDAAYAAPASAPTAI